MEIRAFLALVVPFIVLVYFAVLLFLQPPRNVLLPSLLGGLIMGLINIVVDIVAYYAHLWYYALNGLTFHVPLPFYITPVLIYGSLVYILIWHFWRGRGHWFALLLLFGVPIFGILRDVLGIVTQTSYATWESVLAGPVDVGMWLVMFYTGFLVFRRLAPSRKPRISRVSS